MSVTVHVEEPTLPSNFAEKTFTFNVNPDAYYTSFEGACPNGWTLTGDWQCGVPTNVGPATAFVGTQCLATQIAGHYSDLQTWAGTTATSPDIDLTGRAEPDAHVPDVGRHRGLDLRRRQPADQHRRRDELLDRQQRHCRRTR